MSNKNQMPMSSQWIIAYYKAVSKAWTDKQFKAQLLQDANNALSTTFDFQAPPNIIIQFQEILNNDFSSLPSHLVSDFDTPQERPMLFKVPLPAPPASIHENPIEYLTSFAQADKFQCFCCCC